MLHFLEVNKMKRKLIGCFVGLMLVVVALPVSSSVFSLGGSGDFEKFSDCYIEISGILSETDYPSIIGISMWKMVFLRPEGNDDPAAFILYWFLRYKESASITIYDQQNGNILWQHDGVGEYQFRILWFSGSYEPIGVPGNSLQTDISGTVKAIQIKAL